MLIVTPLCGCTASPLCCPSSHICLPACCAYALTLLPMLPAVQPLRCAVLTFLVLRFMRMSSLRLSVMGVYSCIQDVFRGVILFWGTGICRIGQLAPAQAGRQAHTVSKDEQIREHRGGVLWHRHLNCQPVGSSTDRQTGRQHMP